MTHLPKQYEWLAKEPGPKMLIEALGLFGTLEAEGTGDNPTILGWAKELGLDKVYTHDAIPWCGLFMAVVAKRADKKVPDTPLWALAWADFGKPSALPMLGDVLTFKRQGGGHVAQYIGEDPLAYHVLGANQSDCVCIIRIAKSRLYKARRPLYHQQPDNVRRIFLSTSGKLSTNEA